MRRSWLSCSAFLFALCFSKSSSAGKTPLHKVTFTQKGYIQFLRWDLPVPEITGFTFCLWVNSSNLTHAHSFFSYSKNESERRVRSWISPLGRSVHLEIDGVDIVTLRTRLAENQWYHVCQSWDNGEGRYAMWIDGRIVAQGRAPQMIGHVIKGSGDIVVGQEYTDFDKGLEEGIEGSILGFNLLLASAFDRVYKDDDYANAITPSGPGFGSRLKRDVGFASAINENSPLGLQLVELSYGHCEIGRGSPFIEDSLMLISWTRTPVRVFGGALVKNVDADCGRFTLI